MLRRICWALVMLIPLSQSANAAGFKCTLNHTTRVGASGSYEDENSKSTTVDFFLAIDEKDGTGTSSVCNQTACDNSELLVLKHQDDDHNIFRSILLVSRSASELWSLESYGDPNKYRAVAVSINGQLSQSRFGQCVRIIHTSGE